MSEIQERALEVPQDAEPGLAGIISLGPAEAFMKQIVDLGSAARNRSTPEAAALLSAIELLARALENEPFAGAATQRDMMIFAVGRAAGRWAAAEEQKGGKIRERRQQVGRRNGAQATKAAKTRVRAEEAERLKAKVAEMPSRLKHTQKLILSAKALGLSHHKIATLRDMCPTPTNKKGPGLST